jgi:hypothetical protein
MKTLSIAYRLYLVGYRKLESDNEVPTNYSLLKEKEDEPYPITIFGISKPISSNKISHYLNPEFYYYLEIFKNIKRYGLPYDNFLNAPHWLLNLIDRFDSITEEYNRYKAIKGIL